jgi:hypothetical protein
LQRQVERAGQHFVEAEQQHPQAEGQNDKSVDGREEVKAFFTHKFLWVSYILPADSFKNNNNIKFNFLKISFLRFYENS